MKIGDMRPRLLEMQNLEAGDAEKVPEAPGCCALVGPFYEGDCVLYLGRGSNLREIFIEMRADANMRRETPDGEARYFMYESWTEDAAAANEARLIANFREAEGRLPYLNVPEN